MKTLSILILLFQVQLKSYYIMHIGSKKFIGLQNEKLVLVKKSLAEPFIFIENPENASKMKLNSTRGHGHLVMEATIMTLDVDSDDKYDYSLELTENGFKLKYQEACIEYSREKEAFISNLCGSNIDQYFEPISSVELKDKHVLMDVPAEMTKMVQNSNMHHYRGPPDEIDSYSTDSVELAEIET